MTLQEQQWFEQLHEVKTTLVVSHDRAMEPIEDWFADEKDLYSDTAHFVYELLQNADDAGSTEARFELCEDKLVFAHKGEHTRHFTVSPIANRANDVGTERYGSVNALTDRNGTTKKGDNDQGNAIGKFGRGFKSVYAYTRTPEIYDQNLRFKLERFIIPVNLSDQPDYSGRDPNETLFVLPFDRGEEMPAEQAVDQIRVKLKELVFPTLFLRNLKSIRFQDGTATGEYGKRIVEQRLFANGDVAERIQMSFSLSNPANENIDNLWLFSRTTVAGYKVSVGFFIDENGALVQPPSPKPAFCYFPTRHPTGLNFIVHAPFRLTATREKIKEETSEPHNREMVSALAALAADSIEHLRDLRNSAGASLVTDDIIDIIPTRRTTKADYREQLDLSPFSARMLEKFQNSRVIPIKSGGHVVKANAYWPESEDISEVFSESQLRDLVSNQNAGWAFASRWADRQREPDKYDFIAAITNLSQSPVTKCWTAYQLISRLNGVFMKNQTLDWLFRLHEWIAKDSHRIGYAKRIPIFLNQYNVPVCPYGPDNEQPLLKPSSRPDARCPENRKSKTVLRDFLEHDGSRHLLERYNAHEPTSLDDVLLFLDTEWDAVSDEDHLAVFGSVFEAYCRMSATEQNTVVTKLRQKSFLAKDLAGNRERKPCSELYCDLEELKRYFRNATVFYLDKTYEESVQQESRDCWIELTHRLELASLPRTNRRYDLRVSDFPAMYMAEWRIHWEQPAASHRNEQTWAEKEIDCLSDNLASLCRSENNEEKFLSSKTIWDMLRAIVKFHYDNGTTSLDTLQNIIFPQGKHLYQNYGDKEQMFDNLLLFKLRTSPWLKDRSGSFKSPRELTIQDLDDGYRSDDVGNKLLQKLLGLKNDDTTFALEMLKKANPGLSIKDVQRLIEQQKRPDDGNVGGAVNADSGMANSGVADGNHLESESVLSLDGETLKHLMSLRAKKASFPSVLSDSAERKKAAVFSIKDYLSLNLRIPWYQRPYEWKEGNVVELLDDICEARRANTSRYRIGSIILHDNDSEGFCDIVDGQQRTLTLLLVLCALSILSATPSGSDTNGMVKLLNADSFYPALSQCKTSRRNLRNNLVCITEYFRTREGSEDAVREAIVNNQLEVVVIRVQERSEAFQLFDSQNSKGRPLEPHDLLKAFHLRLVPDEKKTDDERKIDKTEMVEKWEAHDSSEIGRLFNELLFRIYKWNQMEECYRFTAQDIGVFKGVPIQAGTIGAEPVPKQYGYVSRAVESKNCFQIGEPFVPGEDFFAMVEHYFDLYREINKRVKRIEAVESAKTSCRSKYLEPLFDAVLLDYFDRFGFTETVNPELAIKKLCQWAFSVRLDVSYLGPKTPNRYALGARGTQSKYSNSIPLFARIKTAAEPTEITNIRLDIPSKSGDGADNYADLRTALKSLGNI